MVVPGAGAYGAGAIGGGVFAGLGRIAYERDVNHGEYKNLRVKREKLESRLNRLKTELEAKEPDINNKQNKLNGM